MSLKNDSDAWFLDNEPKRGWAYFEETGDWRPTPWHWGAPAEHFPKELGDWVAVTRPRGWRPPGMALAAAPEEAAPGKMAGADSERGRAMLAPDEPTSLLNATAGHLETIGKGIAEAVEKGAEGAGEALGKTWDELTTNKELHKGVEFGAKAAWEVTKDVAWEAGMDAAGALGNYWWKDLGKDPKPMDALGTAGGLIFKGVKLYDKAPGWGRNLDERLLKIKGGVYSKE